MPSTFRSDYLSAISCTGPIYDVLCQRFLNFIATCHSSDSELIRFVIKHAVYYARAQSPIGRNYALCYKRYGFKVEDEFKFGLKSSCCDNEAVMQMSANDYHHVSFALELIVLRSGILYMTANGVECRLTVAYVDCCWHMLTLAFIIVFIFIFHSFYHLLCVPCVRISF